MVDHTHNGGPPIDDDKIASGWVKIYRDIRQHPIVGFGQAVKPADPKRGAHSRGEAFLDLIMEASYKPGGLMVAGKMVAINVGQLLGARSYLAKRWNWTEQTVRTFLSHLVEGNIVEINQLSNQSNTASRKAAANVITVCNYDRYQAYKAAVTEYVSTIKTPPEQPAGNQLATSWQPASNQNLRREEVKKEDKDSTREPEFSIDDATANEFNRICGSWGQKPGAILFGQLTREDTDKLLAGEIRAVRIQHPTAPPRILHAALLAAINTLTAKALDVPTGTPKGRGTGSAASYFRQAYGSEVSRMERADMNDEAHSRADHHVHKTNLERRINGTPRPVAGGGWAAAMAASEA